MMAVRRTFEALNHPKGSTQRAALNLSALTSEYMPSYRYMLLDDNGRAMEATTSRTKADAEARMPFLIGLR
jgi:hypothetical protein